MFPYLDDIEFIRSGVAIECPNRLARCIWSAAVGSSVAACRLNLLRRFWNQILTWKPIFCEWSTVGIIQDGKKREHSETSNVPQFPRANALEPPKNRQSQVYTNLRFCEIQLLGQMRSLLAAEISFHVEH